MSTKTSLKAQNAWLIRAVLAIHVIAFAYVAFEPFVLVQLSRPDVLERIRSVLVPGSLSLAAIVLAKLILLGLVPSALRDRLIHWRWQHPLPGARAFSNFGHSDQRVDMEKLEKDYGPLPSEPGAQGRLFYTIYSAHAGSVGVLDAHKSYLAARDIGIINLLLFILLPSFAYWSTHDFTRAAVYAAALFLSFLLLAVAAQTYGVRFVENVLASASAAEP